MRARFMGLIFVILALLIGLAVVPATSTTANAATTGPAIFLVPHQDDELISYGASVKEHLLAHRDVILVLLTDGSSSGACQMVGTDTTPGNGVFEHPNFDLTDGVAGTYSQVDRNACRDFRDNEFLAGATKMQNNVGAPSSTIGTLTATIRPDRMQDGLLTEAYVLSVIQELDLQYPDASWKAMTWHESEHTDLGGSMDHDATGEALKNWTGSNTDRRYYIKPDLWGVVTGSFSAVQGINTSLNQYRSFGQYSVARDFCESYGGALDKTKGGTSTTGFLDNGKGCWTASGVFELKDDGAHSKIHS